VINGTRAKLAFEAQLWGVGYPLPNNMDAAECRQYLA
jgi:hypothetical protein